MDVMFERMNTIVAGNVKGGPPDKANTPPGGNVNPGNTLWETRFPQGGRLLRVRSQRQQTLDGMEVCQGDWRGDQMTGTGDVEKEFEFTCR